MKKITFLSALVALLSMGYSSNAKDASASSAKTEVKSDAKTTFTYWVLSKSSGIYTLSDNPADAPEDCGLGNVEPCQITTTVDHSSNLQISEADMNDAGQTTIEEKRPAVN